MTKKQLEKELMKAEERASRNFATLIRIQNIIQKADATHEMAILTLKDIKKVLAM